MLIRLLSSKICMIMKYSCSNFNFYQIWNVWFNFEHLKLIKNDHSVMLFSFFLFKFPFNNFVSL